MTNREYLEKEIEKIKNRISSALERFFTLIAFMFMISDIVMIVCAIKISPLFWIPVYPDSVFTSALFYVVICEWLDKEHKEKNK